MSELSRLVTIDGARVFRTPERRFVLDAPANDPVAAFTCRLDEDFYESLRVEASHELGVQCVWRPV